MNILGIIISIFLALSIFAFFKSIALAIITLVIGGFIISFFKKDKKDTESVILNTILANR